jgi:hypothetical protein
MSVEQARKQAQDAIVRLWPLNVRFQDYVREGIDQRLLQTLFRDLGLATNEPSPPKPQSQPAPAISATKDSAERDHNYDQAEERKDRIARLLAAKGSKPTTASQSNTPARTQSPPQITTTARPQSEKSRLLQQKMEALQRAREAKAQQSAQTSEPTTDRSDTPQVDVPAETVDRPQTAEAPDGLEQRNSRSTPSIPGLFLSSTPQPGPSPRPQKRPVASDLNKSSDIATKRPFGQPRQSQPFLIDVSDDDDDDEDAAMEIDSPESHPVTINKPSSPFKIPHLADLTGSLVQIPNRHVSSPGAVLTPGGATPAVKKQELANMDKEIEAMKRKIAEAEARKRVKLSLPSSPSTPMSAEHNDRDSVSSKVASAKLAASTEEPDATRDTLTPLPPSETHQEEPLRRSETTLPKRRSVSRAASERLPLIEAHRKQQLLKLQMLQSQIRKVEEEIQKSLAEEKALMEEEGSQSGHNSAQEGLSAKQGSCRSLDLISELCYERRD